MAAAYAHHLRIYCERTSDSLFAEPFNVLSNIGFFIAAGLLFHLWRKARDTDVPLTDVAILIFLTAAIGTGSAIFHAYATMGSILFDVIPIALFTIFFMYVFARRILKASRLVATLLFVLLAFINLVYKYYVYRAIDGYVSYIPTTLFLLAIALYLLFSHNPSGKRVLGAALLAVVSIGLRMVDRSWCTTIPIGTHFLWHLFNAAVIYMLVRELMVYRLGALRNGVRNGNR